MRSTHRRRARGEGRQVSAEAPRSNLYDEVTARIVAELSKKGHGEAAVRVGEAISTHMSLIVPLDQYPAENTLLAVGATCDIFGAYVRRIEPSTLAATVERAPRTGLFEAFGPFLSKPHLEDSRTALLVQMGVFESNGEHPIEAVLAAR